MNYNEEAYLYYNPDIAAGVERGDFESAKEHFDLFGHLENRIHTWPDGYNEFDEQAYLTFNTDIYAAVERNEIKSGLSHFLAKGHTEQRIFSWSDENETNGGGIWSKYSFLYPDTPLKVDAEFAVGNSNDVITMQTVTEMYDFIYYSRNNELSENSIWEVASRNFSRFLAAIETNDFAATSAFLVNIFQNNLTDGLGGGASTYELAKRYPKSYMSLMADKLIRLQEQIGIRGPRSVEQRINYLEQINIKVDDEVKRLCCTLGLLPSLRPNLGGIFGFSVDSQVWAIRDFEHIALALHLKEFFGSLEDLSIIEIGGGYGGLAYWLMRLGAKNVIVYDLPFVTLLQYFFLKHCSVNYSVTLGNQKRYDTDEPSIHLDSCDNVSDVTSSKSNIFVNQDSFSEMDHETVENYLNIISSSGAYLVSVNQQSMAKKFDGNQLDTSEIILSTGKFVRILRCPFYLRSGYTLEIYKTIER